MQRQRVVGYLAAKKDRNKVVIMVNEGELKEYFHANLDEVLEVVAGRRAYCKVYKFMR